MEAIVYTCAIRTWICKISQKHNKLSHNRVKFCLFIHKFFLLKGVRFLKINYYKTSHWKKERLKLNLNDLFHYSYDDEEVLIEWFFRNKSTVTSDRSGFFGARQTCLLWINTFAGSRAGANLHLNVPLDNYPFVAASWAARNSSIWLIRPESSFFFVKRRRRSSSRSSL